jgi:hypothetical protein
MITCFSLVPKIIMAFSWNNIITGCIKITKEHLRNKRTQSILCHFLHLLFSFVSIVVEKLLYVWLIPLY